jgi:hypothetical protein
MKRHAMVLLVLFAACAPVSAGSAVWKVQKGARVLYVGATCHILRPSDYPLPPEFERAYQSCDALVFETDIASLEDPATQQKLLAESVYQDGTTIRDHLSPAAYGKLKDYCASNDIPLLALQQFKPAMLVVALTTMELKKLGVNEHGVDLFFHRRAGEDGKPVAGLETVDEQIAFLLAMADGHEDLFVSYAMDDMQNIKRDFDVMAAAWRKGDADGLNKMMVAELKDRLPLLYKRLITDRNARWLPALDGYLKSPQVEFVLVGAGHVVGPEGILAALRQKGCKITPL